MPRQIPRWTPRLGGRATSQYGGVHGVFQYPDGTDWYTGGPGSKSRPLHYPYNSPKLTQPTQVAPCI